MICIASFQLRRIASRTYLRSDDDIIRARFRTLGVQEYKLKIEGGIGLLYSFAEKGGHSSAFFFSVVQVSQVLLVKLGATGISMMLVRW
jgi:hypothetical protein